MNFFGNIFRTAPRVPPGDRIEVGFRAPENVNYAATVVQLGDVYALENCDNVEGTMIFGQQAIVGKGTKPGTVGVVFPAETQLSQDYCRANNLYRHKEFNADPAQAGHLEDNRRVRAVKFRKHPSTCLFMPLSSLSFLGVTDSELSVGMTFDAVDGNEVCRKYARKVRAARGNRQAQAARLNRVDTRFIPEHLDSENYFRNDRNIDPETNVVVTHKLHGTSGRWSWAVVSRPLTVVEKVAKFLGAKVQETEFAEIAGSRRAIKDPDSPYYKDAQHYYDTDIWVEWRDRLTGKIPKGYVIYGEIVGWTSEGSAIQKNYTYNLPEKTSELYVYRVAHVNADGVVTDLPWDHVVAFCAHRNIRTVPELWRGKHKDFKVADFVDQRFYPAHPHAVPLSTDGTVDEGVCVRVDTMTPYILKAKGPKFYEHETKMLDEEAPDLEAEESAPTETAE